MIARVARRLVAGFFLAALLWPVYTSADTFDVLALGIRGGVSDDRNEEDFTQVEAFAELELPWSWEFDNGWGIGTRLVGAIGVLTADGDSGAVFNLGPGLDIYHDSGFTIGAGVLPTLISRTEYGREDFGGNFQFTSYAGLSYTFGEHFALGYRWSHMSNAGLSSPNPGVNMNMLVLGYRF